MKISIFGLGYVGCVSAGCLSYLKHEVIGNDINETKVRLINNGRPTIIENGIDRFIGDGYVNRTITATTDYLQAVTNSEVSIITVGTPSTREGHLDLSQIFKTAKQIGIALKTKTNFHTIIIRSTVFPGTNEKVGQIIELESGKKNNLDFGVVSNPEFLREGNAINDYFTPSYTVIGTNSEEAYEVTKALYQGIEAPIIRVSIPVAEVIKYVNNSFHALKICFSNEIGTICKKLGIDSYELMDLFIKDKKLNISGAYLKPGFSYGGSCLPKDLKALKTLSHDLYLNTPVIDSIDISNKKHLEDIFQMIIDKNVKNIGILGISFKEGTDDLRNSPMVDLAEALIGKGINLVIYDHNINLSNLLGANRAFIDTHLPHLDLLIQKDLNLVMEKSDLILINQKHEDLINLMDKFPNKLFIDFVRLQNFTSSGNYEGICW